MNSKTKIIVLRMKELIYTGIFVALGILFLVLLFLMFRPKEDEPDTTPTSPVEESNSAEDTRTRTSYIPGVYSTALSLGSYTLNVEVVVDENNINSVRLVNLDEAVATMYPLLEPAVDSLATQICTNQSLEEISYSADNKYTIMVLLQAVKTTLEKASVQ